jgi:crotonobetainyl-CoA:carnitine CoA-transferase CaiB-like acyl-CoA transferase
MAELIGMPQLADDPRFRTFPDRFAHRDELIPLVQQALSMKTTGEWIDILRGQVPCAPVYTVEEALADEQVRAREMIVEIEHPQLGRLEQVGCPIKIDDVRPRYGPASGLGADSDALLRDLLGLSGDEVHALRSAGAI